VWDQGQIGKREGKKSKARLLYGKKEREKGQKGKPIN